MSYILEALKKSEQERKRGDVPGIQTIHLPRSAEPPTARRWPYVVIVLLLVSLAFVIGWQQPWRMPVAVVQQPVAEPVHESAPVATATVEQAPVVSPANTRQPEQSVSSRQDQPQTAPLDVEPVADYASVASHQDTPSLDIQSVPHLSEMPELVRQAIPEMTFAGHVYSSNAEQRSVIINGHSMGEGDTVINGLVVEQITRDGIIFNYRDQLFRMEILQDWSFDY